MSKNLMVSQADAQAIANRKEDDLFDRKSAMIDGRGVQKMAVALANADGGEIVIGVADQKEQPDPDFRWKGLPEPEGYNGHLQALFNLNPTINFRHEFLSLEGQAAYVLRVYIEKSSEVAKAGDGKVYLRMGAQSLPITDPDRIQSLAFAKGARSFEGTRLPDLRAEEIVDSEEMSRFCRELQPEQEPLAFALNEGLIDRVDYTPNCAGVLLYSDNPQAVFPKRCGVKVVFYDTRLEVSERDHLIINETITGPIYDLVHKAADRVSEIISGISI